MKNPELINTTYDEGMWVWSDITLRDLFAGLAMQGMCANHGTYGTNNGPTSISQRAFEVADAMLFAREESKK